MRMKFLRILPEIWARTSCPLGRATRNMVPGRTWVTEPISSIGSSLGTARRIAVWIVLPLWSLKINLRKISENAMDNSIGAGTVSGHRYEEQSTQERDGVGTYYVPAFVRLFFRELLFQIQTTTGICW